MNAHSSAYRIPETWELSRALVANPGLRLVPTGEDEVVLVGELTFTAQAPREAVIEDCYAIEIRIPRAYPTRAFPRVFETAGRIPREYHHLVDGSLCLGAPTRLRRIASSTPSITDFIERVVTPYLYARSCYERVGRMPFGQLAHGYLGLDRDLVAMLRMPGRTAPDALLEVLSLRKRVANKLFCPCGSGVRLGRCHNVAINGARAELGRRWFAAQARSRLRHTASR